MDEIVDSNKVRKARIQEQLGMSHGAARNLLVKSIMFEMAQCLSRDVCYKCNEVIDSVDDFTIEHKEPWENRESSLFFDLKNIAFSHKRCNTIHTKYGTTLRKIGPEGTGWCSDCQDFLPVESFYNNVSSWNGKIGICKKHYDEKRNKRRSRRRANGQKVQ